MANARVQAARINTEWRWLQGGHRALCAGGMCVNGGGLADSKATL